MKNLYISIPTLALALLATTAVDAQSAKPRPEKGTVRPHTISPIRPVARPAMENRGGVNDECATATMITVTAECSGSVASYDATAATQSIDPIQCGEYMSPDANDLWFGFVATSTVTNITVEGTLSFDAIIEGFEGPCGDLESVGCADATFPPAEPVNTSETLTMATEAGTTYYFRVYYYSEPMPTDMDFTVCVYTPTAAANDLCSSVTPEALTIGGSLTFTGDNTDGLDTEGLGSPSVWHAFTIAECANVTLDYCGTDPAFGNGLASLFMNCPSLDGFVATDDYDFETCPDGNATIRWSYLPAGTYYYAVIKDAASEPAAVGAYTLNVTATAIDAGYCDANNTDACDEMITQVTIGSLDNVSECNVDGLIADYTAESFDMEQNETLEITVRNGESFYDVNTVGVWIDWNQNESFCEANEYYELATADEGATFSGLVHAPEDALVGSTRMRVRMLYNTTPFACGEADYGEIEDYTVNVVLGTNINENELVSFGVFPNPNTGNMTVRFGGKDAKVAVELFDVTGRTIHQEQRQLFNGQQMDLGLAGTLSAGTYTLRLTTPEGRSEQRVVVQ